MDPLPLCVQSMYKKLLVEGAPLLVIVVWYVWGSVFPLVVGGIQYGKGVVTPLSFRLNAVHLDECPRSLDGIHCFLSGGETEEFVELKPRGLICGMPQIRRVGVNLWIRNYRYAGSLEEPEHHLVPFRITG